MRLGDIVAFRRDLLFNGAVQIGWLETDPGLAEKAAEHFAFHGPSYHGAARDIVRDDTLQLIDTASFTLDILERATGAKADEPFALAIAGYGTGKSHLGVTMASLFGAPSSAVATKITANLSSADKEIADKVREILRQLDQPFLVVAINGMRDFDLTAEIVRQVMLVLRERGLDTSALEDLRPRFRQAINFVESFFEPLQAEFHEVFAGARGPADVVERLKNHDEEAFRLVNEIYERKLGYSIRAAGQESLHEFLRVAGETYCGSGRPFAGILIIFDEFGRYLEFAVQRPHISGPGALQQLFESVQANVGRVFLLAFIQYELRAYVSRVAPELRDDLQRYVTRYDAVRKVRLSTNLETLIANLLEKKDPTALAKHVAAQTESTDTIRDYMARWFPDLRNHAVWSNKDTFDKIIREGCWPLHPLSTWVLYRLASVGRSLQQRSALSLLADAFDAFRDAEVATGFTLAPVDLCNDALIDEFLASERYGQQGASAQAYRSVLAKYEHELTTDEVRVLKAILLMNKVAIKLVSTDEWWRAAALFSGQSIERATNSVRSLESDKGALIWNEAFHQYEIVSDAVPRAQFLAIVADKVSHIASALRGQLFSQNFAKWFPQHSSFLTDFGARNNITTKEWNYTVSFADVSLLENQIRLAWRNWTEARGVDDYKGQLIYCYVGPESDLAAVRARAVAQLRSCLEQGNHDWALGAPIAIMLLHDEDGSFGAKVAEYRVLQEPLDDGSAHRYANFILDRQAGVREDLLNQFEVLRRQRQMVFGTGQELRFSTLSSALTQLFETVYPFRIPFPFDGFSTAAGNAATDCQLFTRQLFLCHFDREWISAQPKRQKNRAHQVLVESWGVLDSAGSVRTRPADEAVRRLIDLLESWLIPGDEAESHQPMNLGKAVRTLCSPPYGCNIASAGLVLSLFVCMCQKDKLEFRLAGESISVENWLSSALSRNFLDLSVLDNSTVVAVSETVRSEWASLLDDWDLETTHSGKIEYLRKARELGRRIQVPQALYYRYQNLSLRADEAVRALRSYEKRLNDAVDRLEAGSEKDDAGLISWAAAELRSFAQTISAEKELWTAAQVAKVEGYAADARIKAQDSFARWLPRQRPEAIVQLPQFSRRMEHIASNLDALDLKEEKAALEDHVSRVREQAEFLGRIHRLGTDIDSLIRTTRIDDTTPMTALKGILEQVDEFEQLLAEARRRNVDMVRGDLQTAATRLSSLRQQCKGQMEKHRSRAAEVYNSTIETLQDIQRLRTEVLVLEQLFAGCNEDVRDFALVLRQLDDVEVQYKQLDSEELSNEEFEALLARYSAWTKAEFGDDEPPLDNDQIYDGIGRTIRAKRTRVAEDWLRANVPGIDAIRSSDGERVVQMKSRLQNPPRLLTAPQRARVKEAIELCEQRLDELEVDGLVARFLALSEVGKRAFLQRVGALSRG